MRCHLLLDELPNWPIGTFCFPVVSPASKALQVSRESVSGRSCQCSLIFLYIISATCFDVSFGCQRTSKNSVAKINLLSSSATLVACPRAACLKIA